MSCYLSAGHSAACDGRPDSQIVATIAPTRNDSGGMHFKGRFYYSSCNNCEIMDSGGENGCTQLEGAVWLMLWWEKHRNPHSHRRTSFPTISIGEVIIQKKVKKTVFDNLELANHHQYIRPTFLSSQLNVKIVYNTL